jgi:DNA-binding LacI/PurR family transcriptional regulator
LLLLIRFFQNEDISVTTIKHVAKRAGVSVSTVSHALSGKRPVSDETRQRIFQAIAELGYQPSTYAQSLVTGRSRNIGILFPHEGSDGGFASLNTIQFEMIMEANLAVQANGYGLHVFTQTEDEALLRAWCRLCDGLLVSSVRLNDTRIDYLLKQNYPFVVLGRPADTHDVAWVDTDFEDMVYQQIAHLYELNHREIIFLDRPERLIKEQLGYTVRARQGYIHACERLNIQPVIYSCEVSVDDGYRMMKHILDQHPALTALAAFNDIAAVGAYYAVLDNQLRIPEDFSMISFTSTGFLQTTVPQMTAMQNTGSVVSKTAAEMLLAQLQGELVEPTQILIQSELIAGNTTAVAPEQRTRSALPR